MRAETGPRPHVGYVLKRFSRTSETFIAQEILELERSGVDVTVFVLHPNDRPAPHRWLDALRAEVVLCEGETLRTAWDWLRHRVETVDGFDSAVARSLRWSMEYDKGRRDLLQAVALVRAASARGVGHLHAHFANRPAAVALLANALGGFPFSVTAHAKDIYAAGPPPAVWRRIAQRAQFVATVCESNRRHISGLVGDRLSDRVRLLYNGVDLETIRPVVAPCPDRPFQLVSVGRLVPKKGVSDLVDACALMRDRGIPFACSIVGEGPDATALRARIAAQDLGEWVTLEGECHHEAVIERLATCDAVVLPCCVTADGDRDALPTVLLEAMAAGRACVSTPVGGVPEIIVDGQTGRIVPERDPAALADALTQLARDRSRCARMGEDGRRRAERLFDLRRNVALLRRWFFAEGATAQARRAVGDWGATG